MKAPPVSILKKKPTIRCKKENTAEMDEEDENVEAGEAGIGPPILRDRNVSIRRKRAASNMESMMSVASIDDGEPYIAVLSGLIVFGILFFDISISVADIITDFLQVEY